MKLTKFADSFPHMLSGGMKQRVAIARGMAMEPDVLLMDEPFAALDALTRRKMQEELLQLWEDTHFTVLFVTHSIPEAVLIGNRILLLSPHPGRVKAELNSDGKDNVRSDGKRLSALRSASTTCCFSDQIEERSHPPCLTTFWCNVPSSCAKWRSAPTAWSRSRSPAGRRSSTTPRARKCLLLLMLATVWQVYSTVLNDPLLFPKFSDTIGAFYDNIMNGVLLPRGAFLDQGPIDGLCAGDCFSPARSPPSRSPRASVTIFLKR